MPPEILKVGGATGGVPPAVKKVTGEKVAGMPMWVWVAAIGLGIFIAIRARGKGFTAGSPSAGNAPPEEAWGLLPPTQGAVTLPGGPSQNIGLGAPVRAETNREWAREALTLAVAQGISATAAQQAIDRYLSGDVLDAGQTAIIEIVLRRVGPPPEGHPNIKPTQPVPSPAPQPTVPTPSPTNVIAHRVREGDTVETIKRFFGSSNVQGAVACVGNVVKVVDPKPQGQWDYVTSERVRTDNVHAGRGARYC